MMSLFSLEEKRKRKKKKKRRKKKKEKKKRISFLCYGRYKLPHMNNLNFPESMFALSFLHTIRDNFGKRKQYKMKELGKLREQMNLVLKKNASARSHTTVNYLIFALISMETDVL